MLNSDLMHLFIKKLNKKKNKRSEQLAYENRKKFSKNQLNEVHTVCDLAVGNKRKTYFNTFQSTC